MPKLSGFLNIRKPRGATSAQVVEEIRGMLRVPCGHAGTLDPIAEGVLVIGVGEARKFIRFLQDGKEYEATMRLGQESDTLDSTGNLSPPAPVDINEARIRAAGRELEGEIEMPVPLYSAVHVGGKRLYELAREGTKVTPPSRRSRIFSIQIEAIDLPDVRFRVACSGGTYVRSLAAKWGQMLDCGAHLTALVRLRSGCFGLSASHTPGEIEALIRDGGIQEALLSARASLAHLPEMTADHAIALTGRPLPVPAKFEAAEGEAVRLIGPDGSLIGIGRALTGAGGTMLVHPERMTSGNPAET